MRARLPWGGRTWAGPQKGGGGGIPPPALPLHPRCYSLCSLPCPTDHPELEDTHPQPSPLNRRNNPASSPHRGNPPGSTGAGRGPFPWPLGHPETTRPRQSARGKEPAEGPANHHPPSTTRSSRSTGSNACAPHRGRWKVPGRGPSPAQMRQPFCPRRGREKGPQGRGAGAPILASPARPRATPPHLPHRPTNSLPFFPTPRDNQPPGPKEHSSPHTGTNSSHQTLQNNEAHGRTSKRAPTCDPSNPTQFEAVQPDETLFRIPNRVTSVKP